MYIVSARATDTVGNTTTMDFGADSFNFDSAAPTGGSFVINNGDTYTDSTSVTLNITCPTDSWTPVEMAYGNSMAPTNWTTCTSSTGHTLTAGDGMKTVYMRFRDGGGNISSPDETDAIILDESTPDIEAVDAGSGTSEDRTSWTSGTWYKFSDTGNDNQISFSWTDPDSASGDTFYYELSSSTDNCVTDADSSTTNPYLDNITISEGTSYMHVRPRIGAGTWGTERYFEIKYDVTPPTTTVTIADTKYSPSTFNTTDTINGTAADGGSGVASSQVSIERYSDGYYWTGSTWTGTTTWVDVTTGTTSWKYTIAPANFDDGEMYIVSAIATDTAGNTTFMDFGADSFTYDSTAPTGTSITPTSTRIIDGGSASFTVSDGTDSVSGVNTSTRDLQRQSATYANNTCGSYGSPSSVSYGGTYPNITDSAVASGNCYKYTWSVDDNAGNTATSSETSAVVVVTFDTVTKTGGDEQSYGDGDNNPIGYTLPTALQVRVSDGGTNYALADEVTVNYSISSVPSSPTATGQSLGGASDNTDASGYAEQTLTFGDRAGDYEVEATCTGCNTVTFTETAGQHFSLSITEPTGSMDVNPSTSPSDSFSPTLSITTNAASFEVHLTPDQWPTWTSYEIPNWTGSYGFGWDLDAGSVTAFSESAGDPAETNVYSCSGDACQSTTYPDIDLDALVNIYTIPAGAYTNNVQFSGANISY